MLQLPPQLGVGKLGQHLEDQLEQDLDQLPQHPGELGQPVGELGREPRRGDLGGRPGGCDHLGRCLRRRRDRQHAGVDPIDQA